MLLVKDKETTGGETKTPIDVGSKKTLLNNLPPRISINKGGSNQ